MISAFRRLAAMCFARWTARGASFGAWARKAVVTNTAGHRAGDAHRLFTSKGS
jgi:hypothetical protein